MHSLRLAVLLLLLPAAVAAQQPAEARPRTPPPAGAETLRATLDSLGADLAAQQASHARLMQHLGEQGVIHRDFAARVAALPEPPADTDPRLAAAVLALRQDAVRWKLQLAALQERVERENRQYQTISNVLKTRHDTAKNSVGNIR